MAHLSSLVMNTHVCHKQHVSTYNSRMPDLRAVVMLYRVKVKWVYVINCLQIKQFQSVCCTAIWWVLSKPIFTIPKCLLMRIMRGYSSTTTHVLRFCGRDLMGQNTYFRKPPTLLPPPSPPPSPPLPIRQSGGCLYHVCHVVHVCVYVVRLSQLSCANTTFRHFSIWIVKVRRTSSCTRNGFLQYNRTDANTHKHTLCRVYGSDGYDTHKLRVESINSTFIFADMSIHFVKRQPQHQFSSIESCLYSMQTLWHRVTHTHRHTYAQVFSGILFGGRGERISVRKPSCFHTYGSEGLAIMRVCWFAYVSVYDREALWALRFVKMHAQYIDILYGIKRKQSFFIAHECHHILRHTSRQMDGKRICHPYNSWVCINYIFSNATRNRETHIPCGMAVKCDCVCVCLCCCCVSLCTCLETVFMTVGAHRKTREACEENGQDNI